MPRISEIVAAYPGVAPPTKEASFDIADGVPEEDMLPMHERVSRAREYITNTLGYAVQGKGGNDHTYKVACALIRDFALDVEHAVEEIKLWNKGCDPPWDENRLIDKLEDGARKGQCQRGAKVRVNSPFIRLLKPEATRAETIAQIAEWAIEPVDLRTNKHGEIADGIDNDILCVKSLVGTHARFNDISQQVEIDGRPMTDDVAYMVASRIAQYYKYNRTSNQVGLAITHAARQNTYNPVQEYFDSLTWDGKPRFDEAAAQMGSMDFTAPIYLRKWVIGIVARAMNPGCKMDTMLIAKGKQGMMKSTVAKVFGGRWFGEFDGNIGSKDVFSDIQGKLVLEMPELQAFIGKDSESLKSFLSKGSDRYRPPYAKNSIDQPRPCVFFGTTNLDGFLADPTGKRRFWVVEVNAKINIEWFKANRDQMFAEAVAAYKAAPRDANGDPTAHTWWLTDFEAGLQEAQADKYSDEDPWRQVIQKAALALPPAFTTFDIFEKMTTTGAPPSMLGQPNANLDGPDILKLTHVVRNRIAATLKGLGYTSKAVRVDNDVCRRWLSPTIEPVGEEMPAKITETLRAFTSHIIEVYEGTGFAPSPNDMAAHLGITRQAISLRVQALEDLNFIAPRPPGIPANTARDLTPTREAYKAVGKFPARLLGVVK